MNQIDSFQTSKAREVMRGEKKKLPMNKYETLKSTSELALSNRERTSPWRRDHGEKGSGEQAPPTLLSSYGSPSFFLLKAGRLSGYWVGEVAFSCPRL